MLSLLFAPTTAGAPRSGTGTLTALAASAARAVHRRYRRWITVRRLQELDDRTLHDIGLSRDGIESAARGGRDSRGARFVDYEIYRSGR